ncbi:secondary thiamine-phosphate synthase enzyme YjbQ [Candidatus Venteria ishoeyi]|uniref:Secondary thiamine-phosphate synthase enzyme n=1 Tax=Candidatus Venteria ishoeyi TaxID=1899563 RepID=A0A1H6F7G3_9GAMM|nr:secondary thiamine-phosphate synthase enzyme YjbQ [Candidatus Venteria ishoeyi]MDM8545953.1 secondary thiamine-phosphate synthase enzyme YjbQ [Candidatus Venteria ishoeyi]SEH06072.1 Uncharacterised protein [Candidatus Venteria ishoeyi]
MIKHLRITTGHKGFYDITSQLAHTVQEAAVDEALCTVFIQHTSASLLIQENADPAVRHDLENWFDRLVPRNDPLYTHTNEGPDDMPGHIRSALTASNLSIPVQKGRLLLGTWQSIYLWEHRDHSGQRSVVVHL